MFKRLVLSTAGMLIVPFAVIVLIVGALLARQDTLGRQREGIRPRLVYGPVPVINIKYMSQAMRRLGYEAETFVYQISRIHTRADYDYYAPEFFASSLTRRGPLGVLRTLLFQYGVFLWLLRRFDIFHFFFSGGFLSNTPLQFFEIQLLHLAGKKVVVMPFGSDAAVPSHTHSMILRQGLMMHYPHLGSEETKKLRWLDYFSNHADFTVGCVGHAETLPRWDMLTTHYYPIDTEAWSPTDDRPLGNGQEGPVTVIHAPNHRGLKGTDFLIAACEELIAEGHPIRLLLLEGVPNSEVKRVMSESDILAEQFILGYALTAMEGMSLGKVVMSNLTDDHYYQVHRLYTGLDECPIVNTPIDKIKEHLQMLVTQPELRKQLGQAGREYVVKYHSYEAVGAMWHAIYRKLWYSENIDLSAWHPDRNVSSL
jgi:glycosyltransferase involved in cell wall biosynthesis